MRQLLKDLFDTESLKDETGSKSSTRRYIMIQILLIALIVGAGVVFAILKNSVGTTYCLSALAALGLSATGQTWAGQSKSKAVLSAQASGAALANKNSAPAFPVESAVAQHKEPDPKELKKQRNKSALSALALVSSLHQLAPRNPPQKPISGLSRKSVLQSVEEMVSSLQRFKTYDLNEDTLKALKEAKDVGQD